jgi:hypothetical protein
MGCIIRPTAAKLRAFTNGAGKRRARRLAVSEMGVTILVGIVTVVTLYGFACLIADFLEELGKGKR